MFSSSPMHRPEPKPTSILFKPPNSKLLPFHQSKPSQIQSARRIKHFSIWIDMGLATLGQTTLAFRTSGANWNRIPASRSSILLLLFVNRLNSWNDSPRKYSTSPRWFKTAIHLNSQTLHSRCKYCRHHDTGGTDDNGDNGDTFR